VAIHGFSKDMNYARRCIDSGIFLSIGQRTLFDPNNKAFREIVAKIPLESILSETDSGEPEGVIKVVEKVAELKNLDREYVGEVTTNNLRRLLKIN
jgi:Tat protein secretion system quality control protein TatD with DNase activity